ncbi:hypothetical protein J3A83DRAFT_4115079 [Scleroderma citrinum]
MDDTAHPPVRLHPTSSQPLSMKATQAHVDEFLSNIKMHSGLYKGFDASITSQLVKLSKALKEERTRRRA